MSVDGCYVAAGAPCRGGMIPSPRIAVGHGYDVRHAGLAVAASAGMDTLGCEPAVDAWAIARTTCSGATPVSAASAIVRAGPGPHRGRAPS